MTRRRWLAVAAALVVAATGGGLGWQQMHQKPARPFAPNRANDKVLIVGGFSGDELKKILGDFSQLYRKNLPRDFSFEVSAKGALQTAVFPRDLSPWMFFYLVNYAQYPKNLDLTGRTVLALGMTTLSPDFELPAQAMYGKKAYFYVPANDTDYDRIFVHVGEETWDIGFNDDAWKQVKDQRIPPGMDTVLKEYRG